MTKIDNSYTFGTAPNVTSGGGNVFHQTRRYGWIFTKFEE